MDLAMSFSNQTSYLEDDLSPGDIFFANHLGDCEIHIVLTVHKIRGKTYYDTLNSKIKSISPLAYWAAGKHEIWLFSFPSKIENCAEIEK